MVHCNGPMLYHMKFVRYLVDTTILICCGCWIVGEMTFAVFEVFHAGNGDEWPYPPSTQHHIRQYSDHFPSFCHFKKPRFEIISLAGWFIEPGRLAAERGREAMARSTIYRRIPKETRAVNPLSATPLTLVGMRAALTNITVKQVQVVKNDLVKSQ